MKRIATSEGTHMTNDFLTLPEAAELVGVSRATMWRRLKQDEIQTYQSQQDRRVRLVKRSDIEDLLQPRPVVHTPVLDEGKTLAAA